MKIRKVRVVGDKAICLPDDATNYTHEVNLTNAKYDLAVNSTYFIVENGEPRERTAEEWETYRAEVAAQAEERRIEALEREAQAYQNSIMSVNEASALVAAQTFGLPLGPKAQSNANWLELVWAIYDEKLADPESTRSFSEAGKKAYKFKELRVEQSQ